MNIELYFLRSSEQFIVKDLLSYAAGLDESGETLNDHPYLGQYHDNYGNVEGDIGLYALVDHKVAGGAWVRILKKGFGHVDGNTPELAFAVLPEYRSQGLGTRLMQQLMQEVANIYPQMSLSIRENNPAIHLYERLGFAKVASSEHTNSAGSITYTMLKKFEEQTAKEAPGPSLEEERFRKSFSF